jgi:protein-disulfide isomerase
MNIVLNGLSRLRSVGLVLFLAVLCMFAHTSGQVSAQAGVQATASLSPLSPELTRRIEVMIRARSGVPPNYVISIADLKKSEIPGYDQVTVTLSAEGNTSRPMTFLVSTDGKTLAQFNKFDISADPREKVSGAGRPARGGPENAPVLVVAFDDLQCPFCSKMHAELFPAILDRYKDRVHVVYLDFPLSEIHSWAMHAAVDANCLAAETPAGYWDYVDYVHAHYAEIGGAEATAAKAALELDKLAVDEGGRQKVDAPALQACIQKQDDTRMKASFKKGEELGVEGTPALFINGEKVDGVTPIENIFRIIDGALIAAGQTPPPPYKAPEQPASPAAISAPPAAKPGS